LAENGLPVEVVGGTMIRKREMSVDPLLGIRAVAEWLDVHENTVYRMIARGDIEAYKVGGLTKVSSASVHAYLDSNRKGLEEGESV